MPRTIAPLTTGPARPPAGGAPRIHAAVVHRDVRVRRWIQLAVGSAAGIDCVDGGADITRLPSLVHPSRTDVLLAELLTDRAGWPAGAGADLSHHSSRRLIAIAGPDWPHRREAFLALRAGACAVISPRDPCAELVAAVRAVADGGRLPRTSDTRALIARFAVRAPLTADDIDVVHSTLRGLTRVERQIIACVAAGHTDRDMVAILGIRATLLHAHLARVAIKLGTVSRAHLAVIGYEAGLASTPGGT